MIIYGRPFHLRRFLKTYWFPLAMFGLLIVAIAVVGVWAVAIAAIAAIVRALP